MQGLLPLPRLSVHYYDSLAAGAGNKSVERIEHLLHWLSDESAARGGEAARLDTADWKVIMYEDDQVPQQTNGIDCGEQSARAPAPVCCWHVS